MPGLGRYRALVCTDPPAGEQARGTEPLCTSTILGLTLTLTPTVTVTLTLTLNHQALCSSILLGRTAAAWEAEPLAAYLDRALEPEAALLAAP